jgi:hypothetical protein
MGDLFQCMVFNLLIDNADDNEKNYVSLMTESGALELSPAFDALPSGTRSRGCHSRQRWVPEAPLIAAWHGKTRRCARHLAPRSSEVPTSGHRSLLAVVVAARRSYTSYMQFTWSERKRAINLKEHGLDFVDAARVFEGATYTFEDDRFAYGEQRFETLGLLAGVPVSIVHTETEDEIRVISFRKATKREASLYFQQIQD